MNIPDHIEALDLTLEEADGSNTITLAYSTVEELRDLLAWAQDKLEHFPQPVIHGTRYMSRGGNGRME